MREPNPLRFDLIPYEPLDRLALHYSNGAQKYAARNWEKGLSFKRCFTSTVNHLFKWSRNKALNLPMEEDHLAAAVWNIFAIMTYEKRIERGWIAGDIDDFETVPRNPRVEALRNQELDNFEPRTSLDRL